MDDTFRMVDLFSQENLEITIDWSGQKIWINGDGGCILRAYNIKNLVINDQRDSAEEKPNEALKSGFDWYNKINLLAEQRDQLNRQHGENP